MGGGKTPHVPEPGAPPKPEQGVADAFKRARSRVAQTPRRSLGQTDVTGGLLTNQIASLAKKTLLGE